MGGEPGGGPIDQNEHEYALWEKRVDAFLMLLSNKERDLVKVDELRKGIEAIGPQAYEEMSYYERWITSISNALLERGVYTSEELSRKMAEIEVRLKGD
ncbi:MAG: nitrile hydratase subunit beta [Nitrospinaceae bacterium]|nr:nitrile hydratase subunit beta [Nitrospinaceae bacterium]MBT3435469.1 nitrile hydratase subunit beta [Nitrospinaceae bacterium]MBT4092627.1 nitrile hydratase subunit beta [Nitrospinaceae bacterium]MBT4430530.1 nitrile hydratase subunit beta [Nitrospinaceae bacterium]MBT5369355.1 nitrile hydratase subunit beta [Nitrospinaceae bacterium]